MDTQNETVDAAGTTQSEAKAKLEKLRDQGFQGDNEKLAIVLGRTAEELENIFSGSEEIDDDLAMKVNGIAQQRGIELG